MKQSSYIETFENANTAIENFSKAIGDHLVPLFQELTTTIQKWIKTLRRQQLWFALPIWIPVRIRRYIVMHCPIWLLPKLDCEKWERYIEKYEKAVPEL